MFILQVTALTFAISLLYTIIHSTLVVQIRALAGECFSRVGKKKLHTAIS